MEQPLDDPRAIGSYLGSLLSRLGIAPVDTTDAALAAAQAILDQQGLDATAASVRYGELIIVCAAPTAYLVRFHVDVILAAVEERSPGAISSVRVRVGPSH